MFQRESLKDFDFRVWFTSTELNGVKLNVF